jgi:hypothetical protein
LPAKLTPALPHRSNGTDREEARTNRSRLLSSFFQKNTHEEPTPSPASFMHASASITDSLEQRTVTSRTMDQQLALHCRIWFHLSGSSTWKQGCEYALGRTTRKRQC